MHLSDDELREWRDGHRDAERDRILTHLGECESCARRYAGIFRTRPLDSPAIDAPQEIKKRGYDVYVDPVASKTSRWATSIFRPVAALASAAVIVLVLWTMRDNSTEPVYRGGSDVVELVAPEDNAAVSNQVTFEWRAEKASGCRLRVFDPSKPEAPVIDRRAASGTQPSAPERELLAAGVTYRWFVECSSADGDRLVSPSRRFNIR